MRDKIFDKIDELTKCTNPNHYAGHDKFIQYMGDYEIGGFGDWQFANGFNVALELIKIELEKGDKE